jgi:hemoglobin-like flavoprotein
MASLRDPGALSLGVARLGSHHSRIGVQPHHFPIVRDLLLETVEEFAGQKWTPQTSSCWLRVLDAICGEMAQVVDRELHK